MYTLQTRIVLDKVSAISIFIQLLVSLHKSVKLIQIYPASRFFFWFSRYIKLTRKNERIICSGSETSNDYVEDPSINSLENLIGKPRERHKFKHTSVSDFVKRTVGSSAEGLKTNNSR